MMETAFASLRARAIQPPLYEKSTVAFWDDDHISQRMLDNHLDPLHDSASRKPAFMDASTRWVADILPPDSYPTLLDAGCGPGLYAERFARAGFNVTGVDISRRALDFARRSAACAGLDIHFVRQNYLALELGKLFDAAVMIYCDYGALSSEDRRMTLSNLHRHLKPHGCLLLDVFSQVHYHEAVEEKTWEICAEGGFWSAEEHYVLREQRKYPPNVILERYVIFEKEATTIHNLWTTCFTEAALAEEAHAAGFEVCATFGDVAGNPRCDDSPTIAMLLKKLT